MTATDINRFLARPLIWLVRGYQLLVSPLLPPSCRYYPSCSAYAVEALRVHGLFRGSWLAARRLARCHPWTAGGVDHVPTAAGTRAVPDHQVSSGSPRT